MQEHSQDTPTNSTDERRFTVTAGEREIDTLDRAAAVEAAKRLSTSGHGRVMVKSQDKAIEMQYRDGKLIMYSNRSGGRKPR